jgi:hypothetical protein
VLAELRDAARTAAQHRIGFRRAVAADHVDRLGRPDLTIGLPQQIEKMRIHAGRLFLAPVAHEPVELLERGVVVTAIALEGDGDVFAGVEVVEGKRSGIAFGTRVLQRVVGTEHE